MKAMSELPSFWTEAGSGRVRRAVATAILLFALLASIHPTHSQAPQLPSTEAAQWKSFEGTMTGSGTKQSLSLGSGRRTSIIYLSGSIVLSVKGGLDPGFRFEMVGYDNGSDISVGNCVWTDEKGNQIFSDLKGQAVEKGKHIAGTITGGTGRYASLKGEYDFVWQYIIQRPDGSIQGRAVGLKGRFRNGS